MALCLLFDDVTDNEITRGDKSIGQGKGQPAPADEANLHCLTY